MLTNVWADEEQQHTIFGTLEGNTLTKDFAPCARMYRNVFLFGFLRGQNAKETTRKK